jgi:hypothetical protein
MQNGLQTQAVLPHFTLELSFAAALHHPRFCRYPGRNFQKASKYHLRGFPRSEKTTIGTGRSTIPFEQLRIADAQARLMIANPI